MLTLSIGCGEQLKQYLFRLVKLFVGFFFFALGMVLTMHANLGRAPWDVLHHGLSRVTGLTVGQANQVIGVAVVILALFLKEKIGLGTILNIYFIGFFVDLIIKSNFVPVLESLTWGLVMMFGGMIVFAFAGYLYISAGFYAGPRDLLMVGFTRKWRFKAGVIRTFIETTVFLAGLLLGGQYGLGTLLFALFCGPIMQIVFNLVHFDVKTFYQESLFETIRNIRALLKKQTAAPVSCGDSDTPVQK